MFQPVAEEKWFAPPLNDLEEAEVCAQSGYLAKDGCPILKQLVPLKENHKSLPVPPINPFGQDGEISCEQQLRERRKYRE
jgi:hypothetical protein